MKLKQRWWLILIGFVLFFIGIAALCFWQADTLVDFLWFQSLGFGFYFFQRIFYPYAVFIIIAALFFIFFFLNFRYALRRFLQKSSLKKPEPQTNILPKKSSKKFGIYQAYSFAALLLSVYVAWPFFERWEMFLFYLLGPDAGYSDTVFNKDISYYFFSYPLYKMIQERLLYALLTATAGIAFIYWMDHRKFSSPGDHLRKSAKFHLCIVFMIVFLLGIWNVFLQRYELLYSKAHEPLFTGPGTVEMQFILPLIWVLIVLLTLLTGTVAHFVFRRKGLKVIIGLGLVFIFCLFARYSNVIPYMAHTYLIDANSISWEREFIENNIKSTLLAYDLDEVEIRKFDPVPQPEDMASSHVKDVLGNIPVWDDELLVDVYQQHQELRSYYTFPKVHVGRYQIDGEKRQVFLAARELDTQNLTSASKNWINHHLTYTHGYGAVMTSASQREKGNLKWIISGIPPRSRYDLETQQPGIYFGLGDYTHVIAPNSANEINYPSGSDNVLTHYDGKGGVFIGSLWRKTLFAYYFGDKNILLTAKTNKKSRILFRRNLIKRIKKVTPFLHLDRDPYLVVASEKLYWVQDAYTVSSLFPYAKSEVFEDEKINYIRNSIKIVMDAYSGELEYYLCDDEDPISKALGRIYPTVFKSFDKFPDELKPHVRYPQDGFEIQMNIYAKYHQTNPDVFYQGEDLWEFAPTGMKKDNHKTAKSYYAMVDLVEPGRLDFILMLPMISKERQNLRALPIVSCDEPDFGKIIIYNFPKGDLVYGPSQINAFIDQDPYVAQQFTLWDQAGSQVERGKMIILMLGNTMLYIQPVYLQSTQLKIPELQRVIMSQGQIIVMKPSIEEAYAEMTKRVAEEKKKP
jgi:uncharacterized membrane protein (UPF0182 family)